MRQGPGDVSTKWWRGLVVKSSTDIDILSPYKEKLMVITDGHRKLLHPLSPQIRKQWRLIPYEPTEN